MIPPYCYRLSPLDNGVFRLVADFLKKNAADYAVQHISVGLDKAFPVYRTGSKAGALAGHNRLQHTCRFPIVTVLVSNVQLLFSVRPPES